MRRKLWGADPQLAVTGEIRGSLTGVSGWSFTAINKSYEYSFFCRAFSTHHCKVSREWVKRACLALRSEEPGASWVAKVSQRVCGGHRDKTYPPAKSMGPASLPPLSPAGTQTWVNPCKLLLVTFLCPSRWGQVVHKTHRRNDHFCVQFGSFLLPMIIVAIICHCYGLFLSLFLLFSFLRRAGKWLQPGGDDGKTH